MNTPSSPQVYHPHSAELLTLQVKAELHGLIHEGVLLIVAQE